MSGVEYHRIISPGIHLTKNFGFHIDFCPAIKLNEIPAVAKQYQAVLFNRVIPSESPDMCLAALKSHGVKLIVDIDDYWILHKGHLLEKIFQEKGMAEKTINSIKQADVVTTTAENLAGKIAPINSNVHVIPNAINESDPQFKPIDIPSDVVRIGWIGSTTHTQDVELLEVGIRKLKADISLTGKYKIILAGWDGGYPDVWKRYEEILQPDEIINWMQPTHYACLYNRIDISLIPLVDNEFNRCKSELKLIEAGWFKKACIVSNNLPYSRIINVNNSYIAETNHDWYRGLKLMINSPEVRVKLAEQLQKDMADYNMNVVNHFRKQAFYSVKSKIILV